MAAGKVTSVFRPLLFAGKSAIVTGGGTGIGKAITQELLHLGCRVLIASRQEDKIRKAAELMKAQIPDSSPAQIEFAPCNIRNESEVENLVSTALTKFGKIDYLVNNAGGQFPSPAEGITKKGWNAVIDTNLTGTFFCCQEEQFSYVFPVCDMLPMGVVVYKQWMEQHGGVIVNIIADMWKGLPGMIHTGAARAGVDNLTKTLSIEWAPSGVRINAVAPGSSIHSETAAANYKQLGADIFQLQIPNIPAKRLGTVEEISAAVCFLLCPAAAFISGETLKVDGAHSLYATSGLWNIPDHDRIPAYTWQQDAEDGHKKSKL